MISLTTWTRSIPGLLGLAALLASAGASAQTVSQTMVTSSVNPSTYGQTVTLTATVSPSTATGSVTFYDGLTVLETEALKSTNFFSPSRMKPRQYARADLRGGTCDNRAATSETRASS